MAAMAAAAVTGGRERIAHMKVTAIQHLETYIDRASVYIRTGEIDDPRVYSKTCMKLGSAIDSAIAVNAFPLPYHLPRLLLIVKEVYRRQIKLLQPSLMLLMLPIKAACQIGWFSDGDKDDLFIIAKEVSYGFCNTEKMNIEPSNVHSSVSDIVSRFYPTMKVMHILTSFDVKAGYGTFVADFHISLGTTPRHCRNLWLLVAKLDNMDTSACITSPLNVDFLVNGSEVPNRTRNNMGEGPQLPSDITKMFKYGLNLLQVFGDFDGQYIIAVAFMNSVSSPDPSQLQDYLCPMSDCDAYMSSRVSLYCPLSQNRIRTPVKGHLCKHPQCFDYNYFIEMNSTKPTWKCPICEIPACHRDIRVDRDFLKILNEVAKDVNDVLISGDGSWMVAETNWDPMSCETVITPPTTSLGQTEVNVCTTMQDQSTSLPIVDNSPGQPQVNVSTTTILAPPVTVTKPAVSPSQTPVNLCTTNQPQSRTVLMRHSVSPDQTKVKVDTTNQAKSAPMFIQPAAKSFPDQTQVDICTTTQANSITMMTPPAFSSPHSVAVAYNELRKGHSQSSHATPGEAQPAPNCNRVLPTQLQEASGDAVPSGRMRGSLRGEQLQAAILQYLAPPKQPARANEPLSRPPVQSLTLPFRP